VSASAGSAGRRTRGHLRGVAQHIALALAGLLVGCAQAVRPGDRDDAGLVERADVPVVCGDATDLPPTINNCSTFTLGQCEAWAQQLAPRGVAHAACFAEMPACIRANACTATTPHVCRCGNEPECRAGQVCVGDSAGAVPRCRPVCAL